MLLLKVALVNVDTEDFSYWCKKTARRIRCLYQTSQIGGYHTGNTPGRGKRKLRL